MSTASAIPRTLEKAAVPFPLTATTPCRLQQHQQTIPRKDARNAVIYANLKAHAFFMRALLRQIGHLGVGVIEDVAPRSIGGIESSFYHLRILSTDSTVMVPVDNTSTVGLRKLLARREVNRVMKVLREEGIPGLERA